MMRPRLRTYVALLLFCGWLLSGCSTTKNLPEGEVLYTGIKEIDYGQKSKKKKNLLRIMVALSKEKILFRIFPAFC